MKYRVVGAAKDTGADVELCLDARDAEDAERQAVAQGVLVSDVQAAADAPSPSNPVPGSETDSPARPDSADSTLSASKSGQEEKQFTLIDKLRADYESALDRIDKDAKALIEGGQEMKAIMLVVNSMGTITETHELLSSFYNAVSHYVPLLERFKSERLRQLGHDLLGTREVLKGLDWSEEEIEAYVLKELRRAGIRRKHWLVKDVVMAEIEYMLDALAILVEPEFMPVEEPGSDAEGSGKKAADRYIPPPVKLSVWRRDQGKCVQCGSKEKLEYDHIIPVSKGGSNTERNVQLLCQKCNREKAASIG